LQGRVHGQCSSHSHLPTHVPATRHQPVGQGPISCAPTGE
jgi:hypothetical protein